MAKIREFYYTIATLSINYCKYYKLLCRTPSWTDTTQWTMYPIYCIIINAIYRVSHNWVYTLFWLFSQLPVLIKRFILPLFNFPGDEDTKTHLSTLMFMFCSVTWSIFNVERKVWLVLESSSPGILCRQNLLNNHRKLRKQPKQSVDSIVGHPVPSSADESASPCLDIGYI